MPDRSRSGGWHLRRLLKFRQWQVRRVANGVPVSDTTYWAAAGAMLRYGQGPGMPNTGETQGTTGENCHAEELQGEGEQSSSQPCLDPQSINEQPAPEIILASLPMAAMITDCYGVVQSVNPLLEEAHWLHGC